MLWDSTPHYDEKYTHQTKLSSVTEEEFKENTVPWVATWKDRLIQLFFFHCIFWMAPFFTSYSNNNNLCNYGVTSYPFL